MSKTECMQIASMFSGIIEVIVSHPLDRLKTELQVITLNNASNVTHKTSLELGVKNIYKNQGIKGYYSGILPRLVGIIPMRLTYWSTMTLTNDYIKNNNCILNQNLNKFLNNNVTTFTLNIIPGIITGITQSLIDNPIEVAKIRLMTGLVNTNINNLYQGFGYLLSRNIIFAIPVAYSVKTHGKDQPFWAGAVGGLIGSIISHPFDVIKTERQRNKLVEGNKITIRYLLKNNPKFLLSGLTMRASLSFINMGIGFLVFNYIYKNLFNTHNFEQLE